MRVSALPPYVTLLTLSEVSASAMPTIKMRLLPLLTVCDQVRVATFVAVTQAALPGLPTAPKPRDGNARRPGRRSKPQSRKGAL